MDLLYSTPAGDIRIRSFCSPQEIRRYSFADEFGVHENFKSLYTRRESLERIAGKPDTNVVLAVTEDNRIAGYGVLAHPDSGERWLDLGPGIMIEVKAIEVCRSLRSARIASGMVKEMLTYPQIEDKIAYLVGYSWTWDLEGTNKSALEYRHLLIRLFEPHGFKEYQTNEPNVCLKPENLFMCRMGKNISQVTRDRFKWLRFGLSPWKWM